MGGVPASILVPLQNSQACHEWLFGSNLPPLNLQAAGILSHRDPVGYSSHLQGKVVELRELAEANTVEVASRQQMNYRGRENAKLQVGKEVLLDNATKGKLDWTLDG